MSENENEQSQPVKETVSQNIGYYTIMSILLIIVGLILSTQTIRHFNAKESRIPDTRQLYELVVILKETQNKKAELEKQLLKIRYQVEKINKETLPANYYGDQLKKLLQIAGLTQVKGNGIIIKLDDKDNLKRNTASNDGFVQSDDLLKIINELKASGAKAISLNNQRLITTSEVVTAGNSIMINQARLIPPYVIKAIGPSDTMISALKMRGGIVEYLEVFNIKISIETESNLVIPPYTGNINL